MLKSEFSPLKQGLYAGIVGGVGVAFALALLEALGGAFLQVVPLALALYAPLGLILGVLLGAVIGGIRGIVGEAGIVAALRERRDLDQKVAAALITVALAALLELMVVAPFVSGPASGMARKELAGLSAGLVAAGALLAVALVALPLWQLCCQMIRRLPRLGRVPQSLLISSLGGLGLAGAVALVLSRLDWRVLRFAPWVVLALLLVSTAIVSWWISRARVARLSLLMGGVASLLTLTVPALGRNAIVVERLQQDGWLAPLLVSAGRALGDGDGDGYAQWLGGGDCDDTNPSINPAARDIPGNGVDEDCQGGDASKPRLVSAQTQARVKKPTQATVRNLLVVCVDTLRADVLGVMGHVDALTHQIDALAARGTLFRRAYAQAANTPQSFPSIFTSLYPTRVPYKKRFAGYPVLLPEAVSVFELLQQAGIHTIGVSSHFYFKERRGIRQGFSEWDNRGATSIKDSNKDIASPRIVPRAVAKLRQMAREKRRFTMFVHLFEPHSTYVKHRDKGYRYDKRGVAGLRQKYDYEVKFVDEWLGKLLDGLKDSGLADQTAIVLFSDHAEAFGEHRFYFHGQALYEEVLRVPVILVVPGIAPRRVDTPVALIDIAPTLLELAGVATPATMQGRSLLPLARGEPPPAQRAVGAALMAYPAWPKGQRAMIDGRYKVIWRVQENRWEAYDLERDRGEKRNLTLHDPALGRRLRERFVSFAERELN